MNMRKKSTTMDSSDPVRTISRIDLSDSHGKEEKDLNAMIRRMISDELTKQRKLANFTMKRAHSDTRSFKWKIKIDAKPSNTITSLERTKTKNSPSNKTQIEPINESNSKFEQRSTTSNDSYFIIIPEFPGDDRRVFESVETQAENSEFLELEREAEIKKPSSTAESQLFGQPTVDNCSRQLTVEREKIEKHKKMYELQNDRERPSKKAVSTAKREASERGTKTVSTQTESVYIVRAVRSCPSRRKPVRLYLHLHCEPSDTGSGTKINQELRDLATIYRKSSDNLIYEKGKASRSPAYLPIRERFRWKFVRSKICNE